MPPDALAEALCRAHLGLSLGWLAVLLLRKPWRRWAGAQTAYGLWLLPPWLALAALLPSPRLAPWVLPQVSVSALTGWSTAAAPVATPSVWMALWGAGVVAVAVVQVSRHRRYCAQLQRRGASGWQAPAGDSPGLMGLWHSRLVLPADFRQRFAADERRWILAHEAAHARRLDNPMRLLAAVMAGLAWFNPLAWLALAALRQDQELACDAAVMRRYPGSWRGYGLALLKLDGATAPPPAASAWQSTHPLKERIMSLKTTAPGARARLAARAALWLGALLGFGAVQALNAGTPAPAAVLTDTTQFPARLQVNQACPQMPLPPGPPPAGLHGDYLANVTFTLGADGRATTIQVQGDPRLVDMLQKTVQAYRCRPELAGTALEQQFSFKIN